MYESEIINGKNIFIFEDHATAILPWAEIRKQSDGSLNLFTLDFHSDTSEAFHKHLHGKTGGDWSRIESLRETLIDGIDIYNSRDLEKLLPLLSHDEQIDFSIRTKIFDFAFVVHFDNADDDFQLGGEFPEDRILVLPNLCAVGCEKTTHGDLCTEEHSNQAIETVNLEDKLAKAKQITESLGRKECIHSPYVLDIDLDYFRTKTSINPKNISAFHKLISDSAAITIAKEPEWVIKGRLNEETIDSEYLLKKMLEIISKALNP